MRSQVELWGKSWTCELQPILVNVFFLIVSVTVTKPKDAKNLLTGNPKSSCWNLFFSQSSPSICRTTLNQLFMSEIGHFKFPNTLNLITVQLSPKCALILPVLSIPTFRPCSKPTSPTPSPDFQLASSFPSFLTSAHFPVSRLFF